MGGTPFKEAAEPTAIARLFKRWAGNGLGRQAGWHALYQQACARHPGCWSGKTRNWEPIEAVMLNPDREQPALGGGGRKKHARRDSYLEKYRLSGWPVSRPADPRQWINLRLCVV